MADPIIADHPTQASALPLPRTRARAATRQRFATRETVVFTLVLAVALAQGLLYLVLLPPWQHYDEPTHFEHAWLSANRALLPTFGDEDQAMRRAVAASMVEHDFFQTLPRSDFLTDTSLTWLGITELGHPPAYYVLTGLPLRLVRHLDITSQLYVARGVSLLLFVLTVAVAWGMLRDLALPGHILRWAVPLAIALLPPFADLMTAVNNDAGAVLLFSLFMWGAVRLLRFGLTWRRVVWVCIAAGAGLFTKNTTAPALPLTLLALVGALWLQRGWRWRWLFAATLISGLALLPATLTWGDAAYWYRWSLGPAQLHDTQISTAAPVGTHALLVEVGQDSGIRQLIGPLLPEDVQRVSGTTITVGGWLWADRPAAISMPTAVFSPDQINLTKMISVTTEPQFVARVVQVPAQVPLLQYTVTAATPGEPLRLFVDGAVIAEGNFAAAPPPVFDSAAAQSGMWGGQRFVNLVRNGSGEQAWPHLRPWFEETLYRYIHRSPSQTVAAIFDVQRNGPLLLTNTGLWVLYTFFGVFAWSNVQVQGWAWQYVFQAVAGVGMLGVAVWLVRRVRVLAARDRAALAFLVLTLLLVWGNTLLRPLPLLDPNVYFPVARYGFPAIIPTMLALVGGWWALWPRRFRALGAGLLLVGLALLDGVAALTIAAYFG